MSFPRRRESMSAEINESGSTLALILGFLLSRE
jgi:hypothetical protein